MAGAAMGQEVDSSTQKIIADYHAKSLLLCLRLAGADKAKNTEELANCLGRANLDLQLFDPNWAGLTFTKLVPCADYEPRNIEPVVKRSGWGLPVMADRIYEEDEIRPDREKFYASNNRITATACLKPLISGHPGNIDWKTMPAVVELHNPLDEVDVEIPNGARYALAADFTTPSLVQFSQSGLQALEYEGLLIPDLSRTKTSIYLNEPYRPGKIPVLFVHGLWSSPRTWTTMNNALLADPEIRANYQFFFALYPTGEPVLASAAMLREKIAELRETFDPEKKEAAWNQMVVVCHSMGGIVSRLLMTSSGDHFEKAMFTKPFDQLDLSPEIRKEYERRLYFEPVPEISRTVFLAPVFRGSSFASRPLGRLSSMLVRAPDDLRQYRYEIASKNGPEAVQPEFRSLRVINGIDNLQPSNPIIKALDKTRPDPSKKFHVVLGDNQRMIPRLRGEITDGLVTYSSGHLDGAESELIVAGNHYLNHDRPVFDEVQRVLRLHLGLSQTVIAEPGPVAIKMATPRR